jgi:hypothetical protein
MSAMDQPNASLNLLHTTIVPTDDAAVAKQVLTSTIFGGNHVLLVVCGTDELSQFLVQTADVLAGAAPWRRVVWLRQPAQVAEVLQNLTECSGLPSIQDPNAVAFSVSLMDKVSDVILRTDPNLAPPRGRARVYAAFLKAQVEP